MSQVLYLAIFILGSLIGSFLNVCIYRLPREESVVRPASHCPRCKKNIPWYDNIPFLSYVILGGRCRFCKGKISFRYFLVELITALSFVVILFYFGLSYNFVVYATFVCGLIVATFVDIDHRIIPDEISLGGIVAGFVFSSLRGLQLEPFIYNYRHLVDSFLGIIIGGGTIYLTGIIFDFVYFKLLKRPPIEGETESMGGGDVKLLAMIGAFLGWKKALLTFFLAPFFGAVIGIFNLVFKKSHTIPYGPFLSLGAVLSLFWSDKIFALLFPR